MLFYVQQVDIDATNKRHSVILDVSAMSDHLDIARVLGSPQSLDFDQISDRGGASMLRLTYSPERYMGFKEGSWYDVDLEAFRGLQYQPTVADSAGSSFLRAYLSGKPSEGNFSQFLAPQKFASIPQDNAALLFSKNHKNSLLLTIVDCGHGNWNEIETESERVIYDVGASRSFTKADVRALVLRRNIAGESRPITIVISHWDVDHYQALLEFTPAELKKIRLFVTPSQIPETETYKRVKTMLLANGVSWVALPPAVTASTSREITLEPRLIQGAFTFFRATTGRSRNQTGIALGVRGPSKTALLTGDHHYEKLLAAADKAPHLTRRPCVLVTPHHGGHAGEPSAVDWTNRFTNISTPISCGVNSFGHPFADVLHELKLMQGGMAGPWQTKTHGTLVVPL